jgi:Skp family chaperone for outer membrane proteins
MKTLSRWLGVLALTLGAAGGLSSRAAEPTIAVVNMERIFKEHQRLKAVVAQLNEQNAKEAEERKKVVAELEKQQTELRQLNLDAQNPALTEETRKERQAKADAKLREFRILEARIMRGDEATRRQLATRLQDLRKQYFTEVQEQVRTYAAEQHIALVLDSSSLAAQSGVGGVLHAEASLDITAAILARVNVLPAPAKVEKN